MAGNETKEAEERAKKLAEEEAKRMAVQKANEALVAKACKAYGIPEKYVFASGIKDGVVTIVTNGGSKVRWRVGMEDVVPLGEIAVTGVNPEWARRKVIAGKPKEKR